MATKINYVDETWNPVIGCTKYSPGCKNCYAERMAARLGNIGVAGYCDDVVELDEAKDLFLPKWTGEIVMLPGQLDKPLHWRKPRRILVPSMGDLFHEKVPFEFVDDICEVAVDCPQHTFMFLTKRIKRAAEFWEIAHKYHRVPDNVHLGVSISNQAEADEKIPTLLSIPAAYHWISFEPLLEDIDWSDYTVEFIGSETCSYGDMHRKKECDCDFLGKVNYAVIGCESGPKRRHIERKHIKSLVEQCKAAGVKNMVKQMEIDGTVCHDPAQCESELR